MHYVPPEVLRKIKEIDLLSYLQRCDPDNLVRIGCDLYCTREHDSLKISNGKWCWWSRGIGGRSALDYLIKVKDISFEDAVHELSDHTGLVKTVKISEFNGEKKLLLPDLNDNTQIVEQYLLSRGIDRGIIRFCIKNGMIKESKKYHSVLFIGSDDDGKERCCSIRSVTGSFRGDCAGSDKRYAFRLMSDQCDNTVHVFESAIDLLSYATIMKMYRSDWQCVDLISLGGVFMTNRDGAVPASLKQYLNDHDRTKTIYLHLDNDDAGRGAAKCIIGSLRDKYVIVDDPPAFGKDVNDQLMIRIKDREEVYSR